MPLERKRQRALKKPGALRYYATALRLDIVVGALRTVRFYLITGLMVWAPLLVTIWLAWWLFTNVGKGVGGIVI